MKPYKFDPQQAQILDTTDRLEWNNPVEIVAACRITPGARVAEIGCGTGWFTFELERVTRPRGMVYALDMQPAMLQILRAKRDNWERILTLPCSENEFELDDGEVDLVFHANTLHECADPEIHIREVNRVLKPGGRLVIVEWLWCDEESQPGPSNTQRLESVTVKDLVENAGFEVQEIYDVGPYHYALQATKKTMNAFLFPGQGSQKVGMGQAACAAFPEGAEYFERANQVLEYDLRALCWNGPEETLTNTLHAQPALLTVGVLCHAWARSRGLEAHMTAGHSLGEFAALVAGGALEFEDALRLVARRAELMSYAQNGAMAAIIGLEDEAVKALVEEVREGRILVAANFNAPGQVVVSGKPEAIEDILKAARPNGAKMALKLPVSGAFHSPLMEHAGQELSALIEASAIHDASIPVYQNTSAQPATAASDIKAALIPQMTSAVRWTETIQAMIQDGATQFYELGSGNVLSGLLKRIDKSVPVETADSWSA